MRWPLRRRPSLAGLLTLVVAMLLVRLYFWRLDGYLINDDEGSYLYAAWRIALGERPYCDFLTPQLPAFLFPGGFLMRLVGPDVWAARALSVVLTLGAGFWTYLGARRLFGPWAALVAATAFLLQPEVFLHGRSYRSDPFMLFAASLGVYLFCRGIFPRPGAADPPRRRWLAASGLAFGLATLSKLFGPLPLAGCLLWLAIDARWRRRPLRPVLGDALASLLPCALLVGGVMGAFMLAGCQVVEDVVVHHTMQNQGLAWWRVLTDAWAFLSRALREPGNALLAFPALALALVAWRGRERRIAFFVAQLPTVLVFFLLSREKYTRHLLYLVPALATLFGAGMLRLAAEGREPTAATGRRRVLEPSALLSLALIAALLVPWRLWDRDVAYSWETGTTSLASFVSLLTTPDDLLLSDYSELNFYALRPTTYSAASLSAGAAQSGQITWRRLAEELAGRRPPLVILDTDPEYAHTRFFKAADRADFEAWLSEHYGPPAGSLRRDVQRYDVYAAKERPLPTRARFVGGPRLLAAAPDRTSAGSGDRVAVQSAWQAPAEGEAPIDRDLGMTLRLIDAAGIEWSQADGGLFASDPSSQKRHRRPTSAWLPGEFTAGSVAITVPWGLPAGSYDLLLGLYARPDSKGLDAVTDTGAPLGQSLAIATLQIEPWRAEPAAIADQLLDLDLREEAPAVWPRLLGRGPLPAAPVAAGAALPLDLWWSLPSDGGAVAGGAAPVRLTLTRDEDEAVAADWPQVLASLPPVADGQPPLILQRAYLPTEPTAPAGRYRLRAVWPAEAAEPLVIELGEVELRAPDRDDLIFDLPTGQPHRRLDAGLGTVARLLGTDLDETTTVSAGAGLTVGLYWRAEAPIPVNYQVTVQVLDEAGKVVAQHDGPPAEGARPAADWLRGEVIVDRHPLATEALVPGTYRILTGLYHPITGRRLEPSGQAPMAADLVEVGRLRVLPAADGASASAPP